MKHTKEDLKLYQSLPLETKISLTQDRIRGWIDKWGIDGVYVAISGGKDSQVLLHIVNSMYSGISAVFVNTGLEFKSVLNNGSALATEILRPKMDFVSVITKFGYPIISKTVSHNIGIVQKTPNGRVYNEYFNKKNTDSRFDCSGYSWLINAPFRISDRCCKIMKKDPSHNYAKITGKKAIVGTMASESQLRYSNWLKYGCNAFDLENPTSQPLSFWTEQDILKYIKINNIDIADIYGTIYRLNGLYGLTGENRTGCVFCMYGITKDTDRFVRLKIKEPIKYDYIMRGGKFDDSGKWVPHNGLGYKFVIDWLNENGNCNIKY